LVESIYKEFFNNKFEPSPHKAAGVYYQKIIAKITGQPLKMFLLLCSAPLDKKERI